MAILGIFQSKPKPRTIVTSRPIFQHASSFLDDDDDEDDLKKSVPLPLFHQRHNPYQAASEPSPLPGSQRRLGLILQSLNIVFTITSLCLFTAAIPIWNANFHHTHSIISGDYTDGLVLVPLVMSLLISTYLVATEHSRLQRLFRIRHDASLTHTITKQTTTTRMQPKTLMLISASVLILLLVTLTLSATNSLALAWRSPQRTKSGQIACNLSNIFSRQCQPTLYTIGGLQIGGIVTGSLAWCVWVVVFVVNVQRILREKREKERSAKERRRQRREERKRRHGQRHRRERPGHDRRDREQKAHITSVENAFLRHHHPSSGIGQQVRYTPHAQSNDERSREARVGSSAAQLASESVRPRETIQQWLNSRNA